MLKLSIYENHIRVLQGEFFATAKVMRWSFFTRSSHYMIFTYSLLKKKKKKKKTVTNREFQWEKNKSSFSQ